MSSSDQKVVQYLGEAHASEIALVSVLRSQVAITPRGSYRDALEQHLDETRGHARRIQERLGELEEGRAGGRTDQGCRGLRAGSRDRGL